MLAPFVFTERPRLAPIVFVFELGGTNPVLAVPSAKALEKFDWDETWTTGVTVWAIAANGARLATAWSGEGVALWDVKARKRERVLRKPDADIETLALALSPDGERLAVLVDGALEVYTCATGVRIFREEIAETFGDSGLVFDGARVTWDRTAPGISESRDFAIAKLSTKGKGEAPTRRKR